MMAFINNVLPSWPLKTISLAFFLIPDRVGIATHPVVIDRSRDYLAAPPEMAFT
jgi:hypothetical protein